MFIKELKGKENGFYSLTKSDHGLFNWAHFSEYMGIFLGRRQAIQVVLPIKGH